MKFFAASQRLQSKMRLLTCANCFFEAVEAVVNVCAVRRIVDNAKIFLRQADDIRVKLIDVDIPLKKTMIEILVNLFLAKCLAFDATYKDTYLRKFRVPPHAAKFAFGKLSEAENLLFYCFP